MNKIISEKIDIIRNLCKQHNVSKLYAFGSILNENFNSESDVDFIVVFDNIPIKNYAENYFNLKEKFRESLNREIDLVEEETIRNPYFLNEILKKREIIYG